MVWYTGSCACMHVHVLVDVLYPWSTLDAGLHTPVHGYGYVHMYSTSSRWCAILLVVAVHVQVPLQIHTYIQT